MHFRLSLHQDNDRLQLKNILFLLKDKQAVDFWHAYAKNCNLFKRRQTLRRKWNSPLQIDEIYDLESRRCITRNNFVNSPVRSKTWTFTHCYYNRAESVSWLNKINARIMAGQLVWDDAKFARVLQCIIMQNYLRQT